MGKENKKLPLTEYKFSITQDKKKVLDICTTL